MPFPQPGKMIAPMWKKNGMIIQNNPTPSVGGGNTSMAEWSVYFPTLNDKIGRIQVFVAAGHTPFLVGRPILCFFGIKIGY